MNRLITPNSEFEKVNKGCMTLGVPMLCIGFLVWGILKNHIDAAIIVVVLSALYYLVVMILYKKNRKRKRILEELLKSEDAENNILNVEKGENLSSEKNEEKLFSANNDSITNENLESKEKDLTNSKVVVNEQPIIKEKEDRHYVDFSMPINPREPFTRYKFPTLDLLKKYESDGKIFVDHDEQERNKNRIIDVLHNFGVEIASIRATVGPTISLYEITPAPGVMISRIKNLEDDIALSLAAVSVRIIAPLPGRGTVGIEVPNEKINIVSLQSVLNSKKFQETTMELPLALGKTITNEVFMIDLTKVPHLLIAGATGQGKSVCLNVIINSLLYKKHPNELKFVLIDPKKVELSLYNMISDRFMASLEEEFDEPIITETSKVVKTLKGLCVLMDSRYELLRKAGTRNIKEYNAKYLKRFLNPEDGHYFMPYIVVIIDEYSDLVLAAEEEIEQAILNMAKLARAVGIHLVIATNLPTYQVLSNTIKSNIPGRISFKLPQRSDSQIILDCSGAEQLRGSGDMLYSNGNAPTRVQCAYIDSSEIERINHFICSQNGPHHPMEIPESFTDDTVGGGGVDISNIDPLFEEAARHIVATQMGSTSFIQRKFEVGYNRAGRLMDQMEKAGIVGVPQGSKPREVLITDLNRLESLLASLR